MDEYYRAVRALPAWLARPLSALPPGIAEQVHEIRLRVGCGVQLTIGGRPCCPAGLPALQTLRLTPLQMEEIFLTLCSGSVHSHETEIAAGYVTPGWGVDEGADAAPGWPGGSTARRGRAPFCRSCARSTSVWPAAGSSLCRRSSGIFCSSALWGCS